MASERLHRDQLKANPLRDEFYTQPELAKEIVDDIQDKVAGMSVYCPCDSPDSNIYKELKARFMQLNLKCLTATSYNKNGHGIKTTYDGVNEVIEPTEQDGSFDSIQSKHILNESDVVITNPPFSRIIDFICMIRNHQFIIVTPNIVLCNSNVAILDIIFGGMKEKKIWLQLPVNSRVKHAVDDRYARVNLLSTFQLKLPTFKPFKTLKEIIDSGRAHYVDNYPNILNVDFVKDIPYDYDGVVAAPIGVQNLNIPNWKYIKVAQATTKKHDNTSHLCQKLYVNGKSKFTRILIQKENEKQLADANT